MAKADAAPPAIRWGILRYASVWEDADVLCRALAPAAPGGRLLSIASAGDNALALLTLDPGEVLAVDVSLPQLAALELRVAAIRSLDDAGVREFLGALPDVDPRDARHGRLECYRRLRNGMTPGARDYWDRRQRAVARGIVHAGRFERYLDLFRVAVLPLVHGQRTVRALVHQRSLKQRREFLRTRWDTPRWRLLFRGFFGPLLLGRLGRDPAFLRHVHCKVAERLLVRTHRALTEQAPGENPYLRRILFGRYSEEALPRYLQPGHLAQVRERLPRLRWRRGSIEEVALDERSQGKGPFSGFNLSNIGEYVSPEQFAAWHRTLAATGKSGARFAYWNLFLPRVCPLPGQAHPLPDVAAQLHAADRVWFYAALQVDEVASG